MTKDIAELANKWAMNRYRLPNTHPDGMDSKEYFELLKDDISALVQRQCLAFANWLHKEDMEPDLTTDEGKESWCYTFPKGKGTESFTTEQLYQLFLTNQSK